MKPVLIPPSPPESYTKPIQSMSPRDFILWLREKIASGREEVSQVDLQLLRKVLDQLDDEGDLSIVPYLDRKFLQGVSSNMSIVRFVGMVQDVLDTEYYSTIADGLYCKYREYSEDEYGEEDVLQVMDEFGERQPMVIVPIPFANTKFVETLTKRTSTVDGTASDFHNRKRLALDDECNTIARLGQRVKIDKNSASVDVPVQRHPSGKVLDEFWPAGTMGSDITQCAVLAKFYSDDSIPHSLRLNQLVEMVGVYYHNHIVDDKQYNMLYKPNEDIEMEYDTNKNDHRLPHLHVLDWKCIDMDSVAGVYPTTGLDDYESDRSLALETFSSYIFNGDMHASEALLLCLMSMAERDIKEHRPIHLPSGKSLGCASLRLFAPTLEACYFIRSRLLNVLKAIMPVVAYLNVTDESQTFMCTPEKRSRLQPSSMQLPKGSCMLIDQSKLNLDQNKNSRTICALSRIARDHSVSYRFNGVDFDFETDYIVIVISLAKDEDCEDKESDMGEEKVFSDCTLNCHITNVDFPSACSPPPIDILSRVGGYLRSCRRHDRILFTDQAFLKKAQDDFIDRRNVKTWPVDEQDFHRWLTLTRLCARSRLKNIATSADWDSSLLLDHNIRLCKTKTQ